MPNLKIVIFDPLSPSNKNSHHSSLYKFLSEFVIDAEIEILKPVFIAKVHKNRFLGKLRTLIFLMSYSISFLHKNRKNQEVKVLFFPNADFVTTAIFLLARKFKVINSKFIFRNIGILDNSTLGKWLRFLNKFIVTHCLRESDKFSSETKALQHETIQFLNNKIKVSHTPFPGFLSAVHFRDKELNPFALFIGEPREDKGYQKVFEKAQSLTGVHFRIQSPVPEDPNYASAISLARKLPNVSLFDRPNSDEDIFELVINSSVVLLPYSTTTFKFRGSGILTAAILARKKVVSFSESSFMGECKNFVDFVDWTEFSVSDVTREPLFCVHIEYQEFVMNAWRDLLK